LADEHPDDTFLVIIQREVKNKDLKDDDPETALEKEGGRVKKQLQMIESFSAELAGEKIEKLAKNPKVRWISFDALVVSNSASDPKVRDDFNMKTQTFINLLKVAFILAVIAALVVVLWNSGHLPTLPATVSWNGDIAY
jgi:hypothetical protein